MLPLKAGGSSMRHASSVSGIGNPGTRRGGVIGVAGICAQAYARRIMSQSARSGRAPAPNLRTSVGASSFTQAWPRVCRRPGAFSDVPLGTAARTTACSFAGTQGVTMGPTIACSTCVAPNALRQVRRPCGWLATAERVQRSLLKNDRPVSVGAVVVGSQEGTADDIARSVRGWSGQVAAGWAT